MKKILTGPKILSFLGFLVALINNSGCPSSGFNVDSLPLDREQIINYGEQVAAGKGSYAGIVYGQLEPGGSEQRSKVVLASEMKDVSQCIAGLRNLPQRIAFDSTQEGNFNTWVDTFQTSFAKLSPAIEKSHVSISAARNLVAVMEPEVKTGGALELRISDGEKFVPAGAKAEFTRLTGECTAGYVNLYKTGIRLIYSSAQLDAQKQLSKVQGALAVLANDAETKKIFASQDRNAAVSAVTDANSDATALQTYIDDMTKRTKVAQRFNTKVVTLDNSLTALTNVYVNKADAAFRASAKSNVDDAKDGTKALTKIAVEFAVSEDLKDPKTDTKLDTYTTEAFSTGTISVSLGDVALDRETNINRIIRSLAENPVLILRRDSATPIIVTAISSQVVSGVAERYGLPKVANVVGLASHEIIAAKSALGMSEEDFKNYATSRAKKIREEQSAGGNYTNIYILEADDLAGAGADINAMIDELTVDSGKVVVVTANVALYGAKGAMFAVADLDLAEATIVATAFLQKQYPNVPNAQRIGQTIARLGVLKGAITLADLPRYVESAAESVSAVKNPTTTEIQSKVKLAMAAYDVPVYLADSSGILTDSFEEVQRKLKTGGSSVYAQAGKGGGDVELRTREAEENRKTGQAVKDLQAQQTKTTQLDLAYKGHNRELTKVRNNINLATSVDRFKNDVNDARSDAVGTLNAMRALLNSDLCRFKGGDELGAPNPTNYDGGWYEFSGKANAPAQLGFLVPETKNPLSLFDVTDSNVTLKAANMVATKDKERAAVSLNCFLTAPNRKNQFDNQYQLTQQAAKIEVLVGQVADEAKSIASKMITGNMTDLLTNLEALNQRMVAPTLASANNTYWRIKINPFDNVPPGGPFGIEFNIDSYLNDIPDVSTDAGRAYPPAQNLLPIAPNWLPPNSMPEHILAKRNPVADNRFERGTSSFDLGAANTWTNARVYGYAIQTSGPPLTLDIATAVGSAAPANIPTKAEFDKLNHRLWAWFLSRIAGKLTTVAPLYDITDVSGLYSRQGGIDYFDGDHVYIDRIFKYTKDVLQSANRHLIVQKAMAVLDEYQGMLELLYSLPPADFNAFLDQRPATRLSTFFKRLNTVITTKNLASMIESNQAGVTNWFNDFLHAEITDLLPSAGGYAAGANAADGFGAATPPGGAGSPNTKLDSIWAQLVPMASTIRILQQEISDRISFINP